MFGHRTSPRATLGISTHYNRTGCRSHRLAFTWELLVASRQQMCYIEAGQARIVPRLKRAAMIGEHIGEYQVVEIIAQGGMATVYKAYQPSFDRYVALKVLPSQASEDPTFLKRFRHEARVIARLEHRSILPVYQYGEHEGTPYIAMRLVEGGSLRKKLFYEGPIDLPTATRIIEQVAEALDYAHAHGVVHRDLKPSNILLDEDNNAYLTDFGIAKLLGSSTQITGSGVVGTPSYMSPEQCQGKDVTPASDIYALGAIIYEMMTGRPPFEADTALAVMYMHVKERVPSVREINPALPAGIDRVIRRAMAKLPQERYTVASAAADEFRQAVESSPPPLQPPAQLEAEEEIVYVEGEVMPPSEASYEGAYAAAPEYVPPAPKRRSLPLPLILSGILGLAAVLGVLGIVFIVLSWMRENTHGQVVPPPQPTVTPITATLAAEITNTPQIIVIPGDTPTPSATEMVGGIIEPSPLPSETSTVETTQVPTTVLTLLPTATVQPTPTYTLAPTLVVNPTLPPTATSGLPGVGPGRLAFTQGNEDTAEIVIADANGRNQRALTDNQVYDGEPDWSPDGLLVAFEGRRDSNMDIFVIGADGSGLRRLTTASQPDRHPDWSPDGRLIVYESGDGENAEIYVMNADGTAQMRLTSNGFGDRAPRFSPSGTQIAYMTEQRGKWEIAVMAYPAGTLLNFYNCPAADCRFPSWSPDGKSIVYNTLNSEGRVADIWVLDVASGQSTMLIQGNESGRPVWSGDGLAIFFNRTVDGNTDLYRFDLGTGAMTRLTTNAASEFGPDWGK